MVKKIPCINNCGDGKLYKGIAAHLAHVTDECQKTKVICERCSLKSAREDFDGHNCVIGFINLVKSEDAETYKTALSVMNFQFDDKIAAVEKRC